VAKETKAQNLLEKAQDASSRFEEQCALEELSDLLKGDN